MNIYQELLNKKKRISITGLGYTGLPLALEFAKYFSVIGFDTNHKRIDMMQNKIDPSKELESISFEGVDIEFTSDPENLSKAHFHIICVPTDIDEHKVPDLKPLLEASSNIGKAMKQGDYVISESTVYPGCTEDDCLPIMEHESGLKPGIDFKYGYSPERINPGDKIRTLTKILKIVSGCDSEALEEISKVYGHILGAGIYKATSVKVAEAAKVIENTQRDINISLMNELAIIFDKIGIDTREVIEAASTKWNFHEYMPGLVGGHCISVDPFYLIYKAKQVGHDPQVIAAGRRVNDYVPYFIAKKVVQSLIGEGVNPGEAKVLVMGVAFKENVSDVRNSKVVSLINELKEFSIDVDIVDPYVDSNELEKNYSLKLAEDLRDNYNAVIVTMGHEQYKSLDIAYFNELCKEEPLIFDIKGTLSRLASKKYWKM